MKALKESRRRAKLMGSAFEFVLSNEGNKGEKMIDMAIAEVKRIEALLTEFSDGSITSMLNAAAGCTPVQVPKAVYHLLSRCKEISRLTQGAFDISAGVIKKLYNFRGEHFTMPDEQAILAAKSKCGWERIHLLDDCRVWVDMPGMHISFAAVGKGYAADCVKQLLFQKGVPSGVISASGDLTAWGTRGDGLPWKIGIANPHNPESPLFWIPIQNASVATSGDYEQFFVHNDERYSHTVDPKTGKPVKGIKSVTVVSPGAELSDALATAVFVMGVNVGLHFIDQLPGIHCLIIDAHDHVHISKHLNLHHHEVVA